MVCISNGPLSFCMCSHCVHSCSSLRRLRSGVTLSYFFSCTLSLQTWGEMGNASPILLYIPLFNILLLLIKHTEQRCSVFDLRWFGMLSKLWYCSCGQCNCHNCREEVTFSSPALWFKPKDDCSWLFSYRERDRERERESERERDNSAQIALKKKNEEGKKETIQMSDWHRAQFITMRDGRRYLTTKNTVGR